MAPKASKGRQREVGQKSLVEELQEFAADPASASQLQQITEDALERAKSSYGYDHSSSGVQNTRNLHLKEYELFMEGIAKKEKKPFNDEYLWGAVNIEQNLRRYIAFATAAVRPASYRSESIKFKTIVSRQKSLMFWVNRRCGDSVSRSELWTASNEAVHHSYRTLGMEEKKKEKHYLTKYDLANLIEHDNWITPAPDVAHQHHLCWIIGFVCGVRPGSIGYTRDHKNHFLQWKDVRIKRSGGPDSNNFQVTVTFRFLKGFNEEERRPLTFTCKGPVVPEDVMYSIPHRILGILLRRKLLRNHSTVDSLLSDQEIAIALNASAMELPVLQASIPKGTDLQAGVPASSTALSVYVNRRALDYGFPPGITHYAWRRSAGTRMADARGADQARAMLGHDVNSTTFEEHYNQGLVALDAFATAMGSAAVSGEVLLENESLSVNRIKQTTQSKEKWVERYIISDPGYKKQYEILNSASADADADMDDAEKAQAVEDAKRRLHQFRRALRSQGQLAFQETELKLTEESLTVDELEKRREEVKRPGALQKLLLEAAGRIARAQESNQDPSRPDQQIDSYTIDDLQDARERGDKDSDVTVPNLSSEDDVGDDRSGDLPAACKMLLKVLVEQQDVVKAKELFRLCLADETVPQDKKELLYMPGKLKQRLATDFHSPKKKWLRRHKDKAKCPYGCGGSYTGKDLLSHVFQGNDQSDEHLLAAAKDGLFAIDFDPRERRGSSAITRVSDGEAKKFEVPDPDEVPLENIIRTGNIDRRTQAVSSRSMTGTANEKPVLRLPTVDPIVNTAWWQSHEEEIYGDAPDTLQKQRTWMMNQAESNLRALALGRADESGETRSQAFMGKRHVAGLAALRRRLKEELNWSWADDQEGDDEEGEGDGEGECDGEGMDVQD